MSGIQGKLKGLEADWDICNKEDDRKKNLIKNLFAFIKEQENKIEEIESELLDKKTANKAYHKEKNEAKAQIEALQRERDRHLFAAVLIDGDCMPFKDGLVQEGMNGGRKAASLLKQAVEEALKSNAAHRHVVIRVYSNVKGLAKTYKGADVLSEGSTSFDEFIRGFNMSDPMCDYIDSGNGKECADVKIKANFEHYLNDVHCVQIFFGGTADNGYARLLGLHVEDETRCGRITLIEGGIPFARELEEIKDKFRIVNFEDIFRASKLEAPKRNVPPRNSPPPAAASPSPSPSTSVNYASVAETAQRAPVSPAGSTRAVAGSPKFATGSMVPTVLKNARGQRVDPPLKYEKQDYIDLRGRKMCNNFHLLGNCPYGDSCFHEHGKTLSAKQKQALRVFARQSPCKTVLSGVSCDDPDCYSGHQCPYGDRCDFDNCRFTDEMHLEDTTPVKTLTVR
ncbi:hypothetical protein QBC46DRAFT_399126 [Diplogelasinospora grovesii]|uniref:C3H1-type domain-containing protein n=1 Tax=Diplogelasinospora grovesii TaxID=303347 RepID=A0AAN6MXD9_9PEZI|nr:hypothetical protein QBC46DRAFT_399126 [Diplogelasinospora grovesii]